MQAYGPPPSRQPPQEQTILQDRGVTVTSARLITAGATYAMSNVTSVREFVEPRPSGSLTAGVCLLLVAAACGAFGAWMFGGFLAVFGGLMILVWMGTKATYWVRVGTAGAETNAISSHDAVWVRSVVAAINHAIVSRG